MTVEITNLDQADPSEVARVRSFDGRICILRSHDQGAVLAWVNDLIGDPPPKPVFSDGGSSVKTVNTQSSTPQSSGSTTDTETQSDDAQNQLSLAAWQEDMAAWKFRAAQYTVIGEAFTKVHRQNG
jgi:hypothetical protein